MTTDDAQKKGDIIFAVPIGGTMISGASVAVQAWSPRSVFWGKHCGSNPVRYIYTDEAARTKEDPMTFVAGVIVHADSQYQLVEDALAGVISTVPRHFRKGFISHASSIWGNKKWRKGWSFDQRLEFLKSMVSIPRRLGVPVSVGFFSRSNPGHPEQTIRIEDAHLAGAYALCIGHADRYMVDSCPPYEVATVVAENLPEQVSWLRKTVMLLREQPYIFHDAVMLETGSTSREGREEYRITRVKDTIHFVDKEDAPMLQIADACAYAVKRYAMRLSIGEELFEAMTGGLSIVRREHFDNAAGSVLIGGRRPAR